MFSHFSILKPALYLISGGNAYMEKDFSINEEGYSVRCRLFHQGHARTFKRVVICTHGFGSNKDKPNITRFAEKEIAKYKNDAVLAFDWPCHGQDARKKLELDECMKYLTFVVNYCKNELKAEKLFIYSVSFGGYLTLKYMAEIGNPFTRVALRCPGIQMYKLMLNNFDEEDLKKLAKGKEISIGFDRKMKVDQKLLDDLKKSDITKYEYFDWADNMLILHGTKDTMAPIEDSRAFAENNVIEFIPVEGADHPFRDQKLMDYAIHTIIEFFSEISGDLGD